MGNSFIALLKAQNIPFLEALILYWGEMMRRLQHIFVLAVAATISTQVAGGEFGSIREYVSLKPYYDCLEMKESNPFISDHTCDIVKEGIDIKRKEMVVMAGLCRKSDTAYYFDGKLIYDIREGLVYSDNGLVYECETGKIKTINYSPFQ